MAKNKSNPLTREQELLAEFQDSEAAEENALLEPVDQRMRNIPRTWARMLDYDAAVAASQKSAENFAPITGVTQPKAVG